MSKKFWLIVLSLMIVLTTLCLLRVSSFKQTEQDVIASLQSYQSPGSIRFFQVISDSISFISLGIPALCVVIGLTKKNKVFARKGLIVLLGIALAGSISATIKRTVKEPRPYEVDARIKQLSVGGSNSFPSGHTAEVSAAALGFTLLLFRTPLSIVFSVIWALLMMSSRIVLGVHNFTDIAGGFITGCLGLFIVYSLFEKFNRVDTSQAFAIDDTAEHS